MKENNNYIHYMRRQSNGFLLGMLGKKENYNEEALLAAFQVLESREVDVKAWKKYTIQWKESFMKELHQEMPVLASEKEENLSTEELNSTPALFSKSAILLFAVFFSSFFAGILMSMNLWALNKKKIAGAILALSMTYTFGIYFIMAFFQLESLLAVVLANVLGGVVLISPVWNRFISSAKFKSRNVLPVLTVALVIMLGLMYILNMYLPDLM